MQPFTSDLFANTSKLAPISRYNVIRTVISVHERAWEKAKRRSWRGLYLLLQETCELDSASFKAEPVGGVNDPDQGVCFFEIVAPVAAQRLLAANIPSTTTRNVSRVWPRPTGGGEGLPTYVELSLIHI